MAYAHPARHLLRAKDLVNARYREPLNVKALARAAFGEPPHQYLLNRRLPSAGPTRTRRNSETITAQDGSVIELLRRERAATLLTQRVFAVLEQRD